MLPPEPISCPLPTTTDGSAKTAGGSGTGGGAYTVVVTDDVLSSVLLSGPGWLTVAVLVMTPGKTGANTLMVMTDVAPDASVGRVAVSVVPLEENDQPVPARP